MRLWVTAFCLTFGALNFQAQPTKSSRTTGKEQQAPPKTSVMEQPTAQRGPKDLPVRKVVLYKNGVGYFEHAGSVSGNQRVTIDFTSPQLNDVLQTLTVLDEGGGRIAGVNYNSTTPLAEQLKTLSLGMTEDPTSTELFSALRGQRVDVNGAPGGPISGRLMSIETREEKVGSDDSPPSVQKFYLTVVASSGAVRVVELTPTLSVRPTDSNLQGQLDRYLELLSTTHSTGLRHLTLDALGSGARELRVSYISEVPVWKATYRMVFPRAANGNATVQGWAVVDNTVGADWDNVQLSLVAGTPQSFIQPLSQPLYTRRAEIPIATAAQTTPQTHQAAENTGGAGSISGTVTDVSGAVVANATVTATAVGSNASVNGTTSAEGEFTLGSLAGGRYTLTVTAPGFQRYVQRNIAVNGERSVDVQLSVGSVSQTVEVSADEAAIGGPQAFAKARAPALMANRNMAALHGGIGIGSGGAIGSGLGVGYGGGVFRATDAVKEGDISTSAFDDFFEYSLLQPVTIHKNESAMVPILQQDMPAEHVTLWSRSNPRPLRAVWLENKSKLTLDSGSFSIFESGEFAGEGLLDPIHPGERRLLSYAADQAVRVKITGEHSRRTLHHLQIRKGLVIENYMDVASMTYSANNTGDEDRVVLVEHPRHTNGWSLEDGVKADDTTPDLYRFRIPVKPHSTEKLEVNEKGPEYTTVTIDPSQNTNAYLLELVKRVPEAEAQLKPVLEAQGKLADLDQAIAESRQQEQTAAADEARCRDNLTALKGNEAARRFVDELNHAEDLLQSTRKRTADLEQQKNTAVEHLREAINALNYDWDAKVVQ
ncbi:MAG: carboxypeptidase regulatory-like domain-containing protein [Acidobacteria bacterium]|nr:carboxypeptidase regulatory-like domain-containing protein [Acidobacteriota bacterium]